MDNKTPPSSDAFPEPVPNTLDKFQQYKRVLMPMLAKAFSKAIEIKGVMPFTQAVLVLQDVKTDEDDDNPGIVNIIALIVDPKDMTRENDLKVKYFWSLLQADTSYTSIADATLRVITPEEYQIFEQHPEQRKIRESVIFDLKSLLSPQNP